ncbi:MAG TPA: DUF5655 domain-containing protein, partial [Anaerolineales bacterium]|nr:DUF5655 domain-containing protein [Anaerolineales bacterium]
KYLSTPDLFQGKSQTVRDLYQVLLDKLNQFGPVQETMQTIYVSLENRKRFATALIRKRSIKLVLRTPFKITSPKIHSRAQVAANRYDHTVLISSNKDIDPELMEWLREAYLDSQ